MYCAHCGEPYDQPVSGACPHCHRAIPTPAAYDIAQDVRIAMAAQKNFYLEATVTLVLYLVVWPAGIVLNLVFLSQARNHETQSGFRAEGKGCLNALLLFFLLIPGLFLLAWLAIMLFGVGTFFAAEFIGQ